MELECHMHMIHKEEVLLLMKKRVMACFRVMKALRMSKNTWCQRASFKMPCPSNSGSFALHVTTTFVNWRGHSQLSWSEVRTAATSALCNFAPWAPLLLQWPCHAAKPENQCPQLTAALWYLYPN